MTDPNNPGAGDKPDDLDDDAPLGGDEGNLGDDSELDGDDADDLDDDEDDGDGEGDEHSDEDTLAEAHDDPNQTKVLPPPPVADLDATMPVKPADTAKSGELTALSADGQPKDKVETTADGGGSSVPKDGPSTGAALSAKPDTGNSAVDQLVVEAQRLFKEAVANMGEMKGRAKSSKELLELYISLVEQMVFVVNLLMAALDQRGDVDLKTLTQVLMALFTDIKDGLNALSGELADKDLLERAQRVHASATKVVERAQGRNPS